jgi:cellulose synthase/poly-beta-1,6-N-acetylglucosamine synthase-like glycosyltransferase
MNSMTVAIQIFFWSSVGAVLFAYLGYPLVIQACARWWGRLAPPSELDDPGEWPTVSLLIAAYNEEDCIAARLENALALDYPADKLEIVIGSDGSDDRTAEIVNSFGDARIRLFDYRERRGKSSVLNATVPELVGEIIVFSDANTNYQPDAIRKLVRWFQHPDIGAVCGKLVLTDPETGQNVDSMYWRYETFIKKCEGRLGALLGANGAIYALPKKYFVPIPGNTIVDDFVIPLLAKLTHRFQIVYDPEAIASEESPAAIGSEFRRRSRIGAGAYQSLVSLWGLLHPRHGWTAFSFLFHKLLRWSVPFLLVAALVSNLLLLDQRLYQVTLGLQAAFYLFSLLGAYVRGRSLPVRLLRLATMFSSMNAALFVGFWRWLLKEQRGTWQRTAR